MTLKGVNTIVLGLRDESCLYLLFLLLMIRFLQIANRQKAAFAKLTALEKVVDFY